MTKAHQLNVAENELLRLMGVHSISPERLKEEMIQLYYLFRQQSLIPDLTISSLARTFVEWESTEGHQDLSSADKIKEVAEALFEDILEEL